MNNLVTISIPIFNVEKYIENTLLSAFNQTYTNLEFILVDDRGQDNSMEIARTLIASHSRKMDIRIIVHERNSGAGVARATAIDNAKGEYIFFMDSDDEINENCIETLVHQMQQSSVDFVAASFARTNREKQLISTMVYVDETIRGRYEIAKRFYRTKNRHVPIWNKLYKTSFLRENNIRSIPFNLMEDNLFTFQVVLNALSCRYISEVTYSYYDTPNSVMNQAKGNNISERHANDFTESINFKKQYIKKINEIDTQETIYRYIIFQTKHYAITISNSVLLSKQQKKEFMKMLILFPFPFSKIRMYKKKIFFLLMFFIYKSPFTLQFFKLINYYSKNK